MLAAERAAKSNTSTLVPLAELDMLKVLPMPLDYRPMRLLRIPAPFDHAECIFEPKIDGFRALAHVRDRACDLISRNGHTFKSWPHLEWPKSQGRRDAVQQYSTVRSAAWSQTGGRTSTR